MFDLGFPSIKTQTRTEHERIVLLFSLCRFDVMMDGGGKWNGVEEGELGDYDDDDRP